MSDHPPGTVVIGGGQAGLAVGYHLGRRRLPYVILDDNERVGDAWRKRWDSLRLFTPGRYDGLPGMPFPGSPSHYPTRDEVAAYLEAYAHAFELPVRTGARVDRLSAVGDRFEVSVGTERLPARTVVVATGAYHTPRIPPFAREVDERIVQLRSSEYRNASQVRPGGVLVVGAGNSGAEIALELARHHRVWLSGRDTGQEPTRAGTLADRLFTPLMWLMATRLTVKTLPGRMMRDHFLDPPRGFPWAACDGRTSPPQGSSECPERPGRGTDHPCSRTERSSKLRASSGAPVSSRSMDGSSAPYSPTTDCLCTIAVSSNRVPVSTSWGFPSSIR